jgi:phosphomannomutase
LKRETLKDLQKKVQDIQADLGVALDGDADRIGFLDETGEPVSGDVVLALLAGERLNAWPGKAVVWSPNASWAVRDAIAAARGKSVWEKVGRANIAARVRAEGAAMGGEVSAHYFYPEFGGLESVDFTLLLVLDLLARSGLKFSQLMAPHRRYARLDETNFEVQDKDGAIQAIKDRFAPDAVLVNELDGVRMEFTDWWFNIRKSNTEPLVRLNMEACSKTNLDANKLRILEVLERFR